MKISIITVAYNAEATIAEAVASVVSQRQDGFELEYIIVDGASTDETLAALEPHSDGIAHIISEPDRGLYDAMNKGVAAATGDFIGILNADDTYAHNGVLAAVAARLEETGADALYGDLDYVAADGSGRVVRRWRSGEMGPRSFLRGWMPPHPTFFLAKSVYAEHGVYSLDLRSAADYELMLRMLHKHRVRATYLPDVLVKMRTGGVSNASWGNRLRANREDRRAWRMDGLRPMPWTLVIKPLRKLGQWIG
ncbi:MAG: glycosyltransferase family 2 protein [Bacteroidota bacterium]|nr:glycosyltransferase family 2 protein [Bacteroidota bacterium]